MSKRTRLLIVAAALIGVIAVVGVAFQATSAGQNEQVKLFDPSKGEFPEGIAIDKKGNIYVGLGPPLGNYGEIRKIDTTGTETTLVQFDGGPGPAGLAVDAPGHIYYAFFTLDEATRGVYRLNGDGATERLPGSEAMTLPNGLAFDKQGNLYVSDSIPGAIWRIPQGGSAELWLQHDSLLGCGLDPALPPVGANGVAYWKNDLYVASTEQGLIVRIPILNNGAAGEPQIIAGDADCDEVLEGLDSIDGIAIDVHGDIFALLVIQNKLVKFDRDTGEIAVLLDEAEGLHNPASIAFGAGRGDRKSVFFTNFALIPPGPPDSLGPAVLKFDAGVPGFPLP